MAAAEDLDGEHARALVSRLEAPGQHLWAGFDGGRIAWRRFGDGSPLVLLDSGHGS